MENREEESKCPIPQKVNQTIIFAVSLAGFITSALFLKSCNFLSAGGAPFGLFSRRSRSMFEGKYVCISYPSYSVGFELVSNKVVPFSNTFIASRAMGVIAAIFGGFAIVVLSAGILMKIGRNTWKTTGAMMVFSFVCQGLTFLMFNLEIPCKPRKSDETLLYERNQCLVGLDAYLSVSAALLYLGAGAAILWIRPFPSPLLEFRRDTEAKEGDSQQTDPTYTVQQTHTQAPPEVPQKTIKRVKVMPDGSQVVSFESVPV